MGTRRVGWRRWLQRQGTLSGLRPLRRMSMPLGRRQRRTVKLLRIRRLLQGEERSLVAVLELHAEEAVSRLC